MLRTAKTVMLYERAVISFLSNPDTIWKKESVLIARLSLLKSACIYTHQMGHFMMSCVYPYCRVFHKVCMYIMSSSITAGVLISGITSTFINMYSLKSPD